jgi:uncharacterized membrane protein YqjE
MRPTAPVPPGATDADRRADPTAQSGHAEVLPTSKNKVGPQPPLPASTLGGASFASLQSSLSAFVDSLLRLLALEAKQAAISLAYMLAFGVVAAVLAITGWLALVACVVIALVEHNIAGWAVSLIIAALLSFGGGGVLAWLLIRRSKDVLFEASRRQLFGERPPTTREGENGQA